MNLKPCPFCGATPHTIIGEPINRVFCGNIECRVGPDTGGRGTKKEAFDCWNTRPSATPTVDLVAKHDPTSFEPCPTCGRSNTIRTDNSAVIVGLEAEIAAHMEGRTSLQAENTQLRAKLEAGDRLAEAVHPFIGHFGSKPRLGYWISLGESFQAYRATQPTKES